MSKSLLIRIINQFPKGSIKQTKFVILPFIISCTILAFVFSPLSISYKVTWFGLGIFTWSFLEYILHRWVLHYIPSTKVGKAFLARLHTNHHHDPKDETQVCVPLLFSLPIWAFMFSVILLFGGGTSASFIFLCGLSLFMTIYDIVHFNTHYYLAHNKLTKFQKKHHMLHHFSNSSKKFGVTSPVWDFVFGTYN
ncbi:MAG: sterol desaturase family protein [Bacteriovoracia bacterium]